MKNIHSKTLLLTTILLLTGCANHKTSKPPVAEKNSEELRIIDVHIHTRFTGKEDKSSGIVVSKEGLLQEMKEANVVGAVAHTSTGGENYEPLADHGIIHCLGISKIPKVAEVENGLKSGKFRCLKIYLGYVYQYASSKNYRPLYKLAEKYNVPVVFHTGDTYTSKGKLKYSHPLTIDEVAVDFPNTRFVIAHAGYPWYQAAAEVAYKNPNVFIEGSAFLIGDLSEVPADKIETYLVEPLRWVFGYMEDPTKLMFGTDWPLTPMAPYIEAYKAAIPQEHWQAVFHDNAVKVFNLK